MNRALLWTKVNITIIKRTQKKSLSLAWTVHNLPQFFLLVRCLKKICFREKPRWKNQMEKWWFWRKVWKWKNKTQLLILNSVERFLNRDPKKLMYFNAHRWVTKRLIKPSKFSTVVFLLLLFFMRGISWLSQWKVTGMGNWGRTNHRPSLFLQVVYLAMITWSHHRIYLKLELVIQNLNQLFTISKSCRAMLLPYTTLSATFKCSGSGTRTPTN